MTVEGEVWVGSRYHEGGVLGAHLLVVALENTTEGGAVPQIGQGFSAALTGKYISGEMKHLVWTEVARLILGTPSPRDDCEALWESVAFSNFLPKRGGRMPIAENEKSEAFARFSADLVRLAPFGVLALGEDLKALLPVSRGSTDDELLLTGLAVPIFFAPHPKARDFAWRDHAADVSRWLARIGAAPKVASDKG